MTKNNTYPDHELVRERKTIKSENVMFVDRAIKEKSSREYREDLPPCPICGATPYVRCDIVDGFDFGWSVGCPRFCINDGYHGCDDYESAEKIQLKFSYLPSKEAAEKEWILRCKK